MASAYTGLGTELMVTGEKAGQWGDITNTNLQILEQIAGGYTTQAITSTPTTLSVVDQTTVSPDPEAYLNVTVYAPDELFLII